MDFHHHYVLSNYNFINPKMTFIRHGENLVYLLLDDNQKYLLRIHKPVKGFSLKLHQRHFSLSEYIDGEMKALNYLKEHCNMKIQSPIKNKDGKFISYLQDETPVTILKWIDGDALRLENINEDLAHKLGNLIARFHLCTANMKKIDRYLYDKELIQIMIQELKAAYESHYLTTNHKNIMIRALNHISNTFDDLPEDKVLVHYDLGLSNLIIHNDEISLIDFSLCGYGYREMDISSLCANFQAVKLRKAIIRGYEKTLQTKVDVRTVENFFALGVMLYIASQIERIHSEPWFNKNMKRWEDTIFTPLVEGSDFLLAEI